MAKEQKKAAALKYDPAMDMAPIITAIGQGFVADSIIRAAEEHDVPVIEDSALAEALSKFSVGDAIPPALYEAVAQVLLFILSADELHQKTSVT